MTLTWKDVGAWRVRRHFLDRRAPKGSLLAVTSRLCGLHAQVLSCAELTAWARVEDLDRRMVRRALWDDKTLVKTWAMRGTLHLLPTAEFAIWSGALATNSRYLKENQWKKHFGITLDDLERLSQAAADALHGRVLTREALVREVGRLMKDAGFAAKVAASSWGTMLKPAAFTGRLCFGPSIGPRVQFTNPRTWLADFNAPNDSTMATAEVTRRFLATYGPATYHDLARWWGGGITSARQWIAALGDEVREVHVDGARAWMLARDVRSVGASRPTRSVRLLPGFDQYVVAASYHAHRLMSGDFRQRIFRPQGWISPVLLVDGTMQGVWRHELVRDRLHVIVEPFVRQPAWVKSAAREEADRLARYFEVPVSFKFR